MDKVEDKNDLPTITFEQKLDDKQEAIFKKLLDVIDGIYGFLFENQIVLPDTYKVNGVVDVAAMPDVKINNLQELGGYFHLLSNKLDNLGKIIKTLPAPEVNIPPFPEQKELSLAPLKESIDSLQEAIKKLGKNKIDFPKSISVDNFPPQKIPQPVTNININPLRGFLHTTAATVSTTLTTLPTYGVLDNRRALLIYNNSSTVTIYIGGSDVTASNGLPIPPNSYSPIIDASIKMIVYGVTSSSTANVRIMEISNDYVGI